MCILEASEMAFAELEFGKYKIHKLCYNHLRDMYGLPSQTAVRCVARVADKGGRAASRAG